MENSVSQPSVVSSSAHRSTPLAPQSDCWLKGDKLVTERRAFFVSLPTDELFQVWLRAISANAKQATADFQQLMSLAKNPAPARRGSPNHGGSPSSSGSSPAPAPRRPSSIAGTAAIKRAISSSSPAAASAPSATQPSVKFATDEAAPAQSSAASSSPALPSSNAASAATAGAAIAAPSPKKPSQPLPLLQAPTLQLHVPAGSGQANANADHQDADNEDGDEYDASASSSPSAVSADHYHSALRAALLSSDETPQSAVALLSTLDQAIETIDAKLTGSSSSSGLAGAHQGAGIAFGAGATLYAADVRALLASVRGEALAGTCVWSKMRMGP